VRSSILITMGLSVALAGALAACAGEQSTVSNPPDSSATPDTTAPPTTTATAPPDTTPTATGTATTGGTAPTPWAGTWSSPSCGDRKYERILQIKDDKTFRGEERVSPCPPKVACIWSGIVNWEGTWATNDKGALLTMSSGGQGGPAGAVKIQSPMQLELDKATSAPVEVRGAERCVYAKSTGTAPAPTTAPATAPSK